MLTSPQEDLQGSAEEKPLVYTPAWLIKAKNDASPLEIAWASKFEPDLAQRYFESLYWARFRR